MKCLCGYVADSYEFMRFLKIKVVEQGAQNEHENGDIVSLYCCPKCGTLKVEMRKDYIEDV